MNNPEVFYLFGVAAVLILIAGLYSIIMTNNLVRVLIGVEILIKAVTVLIIVAGHFANRMALAQVIVISVIVIEVVVTAVAAGVILGLFKHEKSLSVRIVENLKG